MSEELKACRHGRNFCMQCHYATSEGKTLPQMYDDLIAENAALRAELSRIKAGQGEAVAWRWAWKECREDDGWTYRESPPFDPTTVVVQALYLAPPASADAVSVPRELLERHLKKMACHPGMLFTPIEGLLGTFDELSALLAQSQEVKL